MDGEPDSAAGLGKELTTDLGWPIGQIRAPDKGEQRPCLNNLARDGWASEINKTPGVGISKTYVE